MGQAWMAAEGLGLPNRWRAAAVTALTGFQSAMTLRTAGMRWVGTSPLDTMARGNRMTRADALGGLRALAHDAEAAAGPGQGVGEEQEQGEAADDAGDAGVGPPADDQAGERDDEGAQGGTVIPAASRARTTVLARPPLVRTGAWRCRPSWLWWMGPETNGCRALAAARPASVRVTSSRAPPVCV